MAEYLQSSKAVIIYSAGTGSLSEVKLPIIGDTQVAIRTHYSGVTTGTDKWVISGRFEWGNFSFPLVPGYQRTGVVTRRTCGNRFIVVSRTVLRNCRSGAGIFS